VVRIQQKHKMECKATETNVCDEIEPQICSIYSFKKSLTMAGWSSISFVPIHQTQWKSLHYIILYILKPHFISSIQNFFSSFRESSTTHSEHIWLKNCSESRQRPSELSFISNHSLTSVIDEQIESYGIMSCSSRWHSISSSQVLMFELIILIF
jgi:hypothetical protein